MLRMDNAGDCIALYTFYCYTRKWQNNNIPKATSEYAMSGLKWGRERFSKAKSNLLELGLIEDVQRKDENGRVLGWYIGVKFAQNATKGDFHIAEIEDNHPTGFPQGGLTRVRENRIQIPYTDNKIPNTSKEMQLENSAKASSSTSSIENEFLFSSERAKAQGSKSTDLNSRPPHSGKKPIKRDSRKSPPTEIPSDLDCPAFREVWNDFLTHRKEKKKAVTPTNERALLKKLRSWGTSKAVDALQNSVTNGWLGVFPPKEEEWKPTTI